MDAEGRPVVKQVRAERTRQALIAAAAIEFNRHGYAGTSLSAVHRACGVTMGALTFHFRAKADLAAAVCQEAEDITREALARLAPSGAFPPVVEFTLVVARLLEEEVTVRAAARLTQERAVPSQWHAVWRAVLCDLVASARELPGPGFGPPPDELELLAVYLTAGAEAALRAGGTGREVRAQLERLWALVLAPDPPPGADECPAGASPSSDPPGSL